MGRLTSPGGLQWYSVRVSKPVRFTHDVEGYALLNQPGRRTSRWFERVLRCDQVGIMDRPAYRPLAPAGRRALQDHP